MRTTPARIVLRIGLFSAGFIPNAQRSATAQDAGTSVAGLPKLSPQAAKALVFIYRSGSMVGAANHPRLFVNEEYVGDLHVSNYISREVPSGAVVFYFLPKSTVDLTLSQTLANNLAKKKRDVLQVDVEAGKTYYFKWSYGGVGGSHPLKPVDAETGSREIAKLRPAKQ